MLPHNEDKHGPESVWNSVCKLQEVVYRCGKPRNIVWLMAAVSDWVHSGKFDAKDGSRSLSDIALQRLALRDFLLGPWMGSQNFPPT